MLKLTEPHADPASPIPSQTFMLDPTGTWDQYEGKTSASNDLNENTELNRAMTNRRNFIRSGGLLLAGLGGIKRGLANGAGGSYQIPRCRIIPKPGHRADFQIGRRQPISWHFGEEYPRPFFFPLEGPSGSSLTRMGHPGAPNHDHHRSIWFAHHDVVGHDFWSDRGNTQIRQKRWLAYKDGAEEAVMAVSLGWFNEKDEELLEQELIAAVRPGPEKETFVELQSTFTPTGDAIRFGQTNFGFLAVRVAKYLSEHFGGGRLTNSHGRQGEEAIFGKRATWMDYSGPVPGGDREGITYFDHPDNPNFPTHWHVREDGWMGASVCMNQSRTATKESPLQLRYLLHAHRGRCDRERSDTIAQSFTVRPGYDVIGSDAHHRQLEIRKRGA